ncbi:response regulator [Paenibacillus sp. PR3]|uniref:Response regulator n=1 Tax=Paenibacillus terricola TaxID=2763503 RepID=A0ABR8MVX0_9BACL|nr:response regulator [Paenibacillus terricola]MBD3919411.1 response regulator [Paenibacillus terricola]
MCRILIVDDQYFALIGLRQGVDWSALGVTDVRLAENVEQALECLQHHAVDLLISDIELPGRNGLDLLAWVEKHSPNTLTIMLTCHADFEYAQQALHHGAFQYLLKPVDYEQLKQVSCDALAEARTRKEQMKFEAIMQDYRGKWERQLPILIERFWQDILSQRTSLHNDSLHKSAETYGMDLHPSDRYILVLLGVDQWQQDFSARDEAIMEYALRNLAGELILHGLEGVVLQDHAGLNLLIVYERNNNATVVNTLERNCQRFLNECERLLRCSVSIYISPLVMLQALIDAYVYVTESEHHNINRSRQVFTPDRSPFEKLSEQMQVAAPIQLFTEWATVLELGEFEELERRVNQWFSSIKKDAWTKESHRQFIHGILFIIHSLLSKKGLSLNDSSKLKSLIEKDNYPRHSYALQTWTRECFYTIVQLLLASNCVSSSVVTKIRIYIRLRINQDITREELASHVYLNPAYLSRMFKKETGLSLSDAIIQERIQEAKRLLEETEYKITDIAEQVGYTSLGSFSNLFKRMVGVTPQQYRARKKPTC